MIVGLVQAPVGAVPEGLKVSGGKVMLGDTDLVGLRAGVRATGQRHRRDLPGADRSLNPAMTVSAQIEEVFELHSDFDAAAQEACPAR